MNRIEVIDQNTYIKKVEPWEFDALMELMNISFGFDGDNRFQCFLPKYYYKENTKMIHYALYVDGIMAACIGLYPMTMISRFGTLSAACLGGVSTHPDHRKKGYFTLLMNKVIEVSKENGYDMLFLGGNRFRYGNFGFESAGRRLVFTVSQRTKHLLLPESFEVMPLLRNDTSAVEACLELYSSQPQRIARVRDDFYAHLLTWSCRPYVVKCHGEVIGYYCLENESSVFEFVYKEGFRDTLLASTLINREEAHIQVSMDEYDEELILKTDGFRVEHNEMYLVNNWDNVARYMDFRPDYRSEFEGLTDKQKIRYGLGNTVGASKYSSFDSLFIFTLDQG